MLNAIIDPINISIIQNILVSRSSMANMLGWQFSKSGKYTVTSKYLTAYSKMSFKSILSVYGLNIQPLKPYTWKMKCPLPLKLQHFIWQFLIWCISFTSNLRNRGVNCDSQYVRCGANEEPLNHAILNVCHWYKLEISPKYHRQGTYSKDPQFFESGLSIFENPKALLEP